MSSSTLDTALLDRVLLAASLEVDGVRRQWLANVAGSLRLATEATSALEARGDLEFRASALHVTEAGRARLQVTRHDGESIRAVHRELATGIARAGYAGDHARRALASHLDAAGDHAAAEVVWTQRALLAMRSCRPGVALESLDAIATRRELDPEESFRRASSAKLAGDPRATAMWRALAAHGATSATVAARATIELVLGGEEPSTMLEDIRRVAGWSEYGDALASYFRSEWDLAIERAETALERSRIDGDLDLEGAALRLIANAHAACGRLELSVDVLRDSIELSDLTGDPHAIAIAYQGLIITLVELLRLDDAERAARDLSRFVAVRRIRHLDPFATTLIAEVELARGRFARAATLMERAVTATHDAGSLAFVHSFVALDAAEVAVSIGAPTTIDVADALLRVVRSFGFASYDSRAEILDAWRVLRAGDGAPMVAVASAIVADAEPVEAAFVSLLLARYANHDDASVRTIIDGLDPRTRDVSSGPYVRAAWEEVRATFAGDEAGLARATRTWIRAGRSWDAAMALLSRARLASREQGSVAADGLALQALRDLLLLGAAADADLARALVAELGETTVDPTGLLAHATFAGVAPAAIVELVHAARREVVATDDVVAWIDGVVFVESGIAVVEAGDGGASTVVGIASAGDLQLGAWPSTVSSTTVERLVAMSELTICRIDAAAIDRAAELDPRLRGVLATRAGAAAASARAIAVELATCPAQQRLARTLLRLADAVGRPSLKGDVLIDVVVTAEQLARMCDSQRPRISTMLAAWKRDGIIDTMRRRHVIVDRARLQVEAGIADAAESRS